MESATGIISFSFCGSLTGEILWIKKNRYGFTGQGFSRDLDELMQFPTEGISARCLQNRILITTHLCALPQELILTSILPQKTVVVQVLKGKGVFRLFENEIEMKEGILFSCQEMLPIPESR